MPQLTAPLTPIVLAEIAADTSGEAVRANLALAENNAHVAAMLTMSLVSLPSKP